MARGGQNNSAKTMLEYTPYRTQPCTIRILDSVPDRCPITTAAQISTTQQVAIMAVNSELTSVYALNDLPSEILGAVFSHLSRKACYQVIQVSHRFKAIVEPILYKDIEVHIRGHADDYSTQLFNKLVGNLIGRPELRFYVRALTLRVEPCVLGFGRFDELLPSLPNIRYLELSPPNNDLMLWDMRNLECLRLNYQTSWDHYERQNIPTDQRISAVEIVARHLWMPTLRRLEVNSPDLTVDDGSRFFLAPAQKNADPVQQFSGGNTSKEQLVDWQPGDYDRASPVTTLRLTSCGNIHLGVLPDMLQSVKGLERFTFTIIRSWEPDHAWSPGISPQEIGRILEPHTNTLVELIIAANDGAEFLDDSLFGTLAQHRHLKRLAIPEIFLVRSNTSMLHQYLPSQLEDLQLQYPMGFERGLDNQREIRHARMRNLASEKHRSLPSLKRVIWWYQLADRWSDAEGDPTQYRGDEVLTEMVALFEDVGVHFEWPVMVHFHETPLGAREVEGICWLS